MKGSDIAKAAFVVAAFGVAAYVVGSTLFKSDPADAEQLWRICGSANCGTEYSVLRSESKKAAAEKRQIPCPKCGSVESAMAFACAKCGRPTLAGTHGSIPKACKHCKEPFSMLKPPGG